MLCVHRLPHRFAPAQRGRRGYAIISSGYIRFAHFAAGYGLAIGLAGRVYWAFVGNHHAREMVTLPLLRLAYWREVWAMFTWYLFLRPRPNQYVGHNPLARLMMFVGFLALAVQGHGQALYGEACRPDPGRPHVRLVDPAAGPVAGCAHMAPPACGPW
ncbi:MAG: hypothetical protein U1E57_05605 [Paenacidovorax caeni]